MFPTFTRFAPAFALGLMLATGVSAQQVDRCHTMQVLERLQQENPDMVQKMQHIEGQTAEYLAARRSGRTELVNVTIPVVVHVVYKTSAQNISDAQIQSQIAVLNADYGKTNADVANTPSLFAGLAANSGVQFCLAKTDPNGNTTTGIERVVTTKTSFSDNDGVKSTTTGGANAWDATKYLNIWVCNLGSGLLGYAQFPGGAASTDGVVILYSAFGSGGTAAAPYDKGRSATHEVGHWLNLRHIWGDGTCATDYVDDTPTQSTSNYGCPTFPHPTCSNTSDMYMNYMDYTDDACMYMFSTGQVARMQALFASGGARVGLLTANKCTAGSGSCGLPSGLGASSISQTGATLSWTAVSGAASYNVQYKASSASSYTTVNTTAASYALTGLTAGTTYSYQVQAVCASASSSYTAASSFTTTASTASCGVPTGLAATGVTQSGATLSWAAVSGAISYNLQYKASSASSYTTVNTASTSYVLTGLTAATTYSYQVQTVCASASSAYSAASSLTTSSTGTVTYCASVGGSTADEFIGGFTLGSISTAATGAGSAGYKDYTALSTHLIPGTSYSAVYKNGFRSGYTSKEYWRVWIDYNHDGDFVDAGELVFSKTTAASTANNSNTFTVPSTATLGATRMRVIMKYGSYITHACTDFSTGWGQVEDYTVIIGSGARAASAGTFDLSVAPNPASDMSAVTATLPEGATKATVRVLDLQGRTVWQAADVDAPSGRLESFGVPVRSLKAGIYMLQVESAGARKVVRLAVE